MCGFIAAVGSSPTPIEMTGLKRVLGQMHRRGPDAEGIRQEPGVKLRHRRVAIHDMAARSKQPMHSNCRRYVIVFNRAIYSPYALRSERILKGVQFHTTSDRKSCWPLFALEGAAMLVRLRGMFAFVIWDRTTRHAFAAREPYGIKPLYWAQTKYGVLLGSQEKALLATGLVDRSPCARGQVSFWLLGSVSEPHTWYESIKALQAGHYMWIDYCRMGQPQRWWEVAEAWRNALAALPSLVEVRERARTALRESVKAHLVADMPVGVFLSGGIDSGALAALMVEAGAQNLQRITLTFDEFAGASNDEAPLAATLARHYGIANTVRRVTRAEFMADLPRILAVMDQPTVDGINTWYATKAVAELGPKVVVSGVGGDELFQGYSSFRDLPRLVSARRIANRMPGLIALSRAAPGWQARRSGNARSQHLPDWAQPIAGAWWLRRGLFAPSDLPALMGKDLVNQGLPRFSPDVWVHDMCGALSTNPFLALGQIESTTYVLNQLLHDSDWATMDHSVELRTPWVDAWLLRDLQQLLSALSQFPNKSLLAEAPDKPLPEALVNWRKSGFGIPVQTWLKQMGIARLDHSPSGAWAVEVAHRYSGVGA